MSDLILRRTQAVSQKLIKRSEEKRVMLESEEVMMGVSEVEYKAACFGVVSYSGLNSNHEPLIVTASKPIKALTPEELTKEIANTIEFIIKDLGIKNFEGNDAAYQVSKFLKLLKGFYSNMTYNEVKYAFDLALTGQLDDYLPKNSKGEADKNHYQSFSAEFITKILNAYKAFSRKVWSKVNILNPEPEKVTTEEEKEEGKRYMYQYIHKRFENHKNGEEYGIVMPAVVVSTMIDIGMLKDQPKVTKEHQKKAYVEVMQNGNVNTFEKRAMRELKDKGGTGNKVDSAAKSIANIEAIKNVFDKLITENKTVNSFLL